MMGSLVHCYDKIQTHHDSNGQSAPYIFWLQYLYNVTLIWEYILRLPYLSIYTYGRLTPWKLDFCICAGSQPFTEDQDGGGDRPLNTTKINSNLGVPTISRDRLLFLLNVAAGCWVGGRTSSKA